MSKTKQLSPLEKHSDGEPQEKGLKTNYKDMAKRYELAERMVWSKTSNWKRQVIVKCKLTKSNDRILDEYAKEIVSLAETEAVLDDKLPPVPAFTLESEVPTAAGNPS